MLHWRRGLLSVFICHLPPFCVTCCASVSCMVADGLQMVADATLICNHICNRAMCTKSRGYVDILAAVAEWQIKT